MKSTSRKKGRRKGRRAKRSPFWKIAAIMAALLIFGIGVLAGYAFGKAAGTPDPKPESGIEAISGAVPAPESEAAAHEAPDAADAAPNVGTSIDDCVTAGPDDCGDNLAAGGTGHLGREASITVAGAGGLPADGAHGNAPDDKKPEGGVDISISIGWPDIGAMPGTDAGSRQAGGTGQGVDGLAIIVMAATEPEPEPDAEPETATERGAAATSRYPEITAEEREAIARLVWLEARGEPQEGQQAVAEVVLNRLVSERFPWTVHDVIYQGNPTQFKPAHRIPGTTPGAAQYAAVDAALHGEPVLPLGVVYFSGAAQNSRVHAQIGGHIFCYI